MGMKVDLKVGESVIVTATDGEKIHIALEKNRSGGLAATRLSITAPLTVKLTPPNKQKANV